MPICSAAPPPLQHEDFIHKCVGRPFEDPNEESDIPAAAEDKVVSAAERERVRKRKASVKGAAARAERDREPAMARAEQLLAAAEAGTGGEQAAAGQDAPEIL